jgi:molybdopterin-guanine dinucleotide biosynthesis protein A
MGRDKALLPWHGSTLLEWAARKVQQAAGSATIIGDPERHGHLGFPVVADRIPGCGPLGGLHTALSITAAEWNLVVACDMPYLTVEALNGLLAHIGPHDAAFSAVVPRTDGQWEPLCAVYHRRLAAAAESALQRKSFKMQDFISQIDACQWTAPDPALFANWNSPHELPLH